MKKTLMFFTALLLTLGTIATAAEKDVRPAADGKLTDDERKELLGILEETRSYLLEHVKGLSDAAWSYKTAPERWSVGDVVEHLVLTEASFFERAEAALAAELDPEWETQTAGQTDKLYRFVPIRLTKFQAPEAVQPSGGKSRQELIAAYEKARARSIAFVRDTQAPIKAHVTPTEAFGPLSAQHWILFAGLHNLRHNQQLVEVMADPGFPH